MLDARAASLRVFLGAREADGVERAIDSGNCLVGSASLFK
jgi:hypothetical protein